VLFAPVRARAEGEPSFTWDAPPNCPQESAVRERLHALGADLSRSRLRVEGRISKTGERYRLTLSVREGGSVKKRTMTSESCADLAGAAAVALGLILRGGSNASAVNASAANGTSSSAPNGAETNGREREPGATAATGAAATERASGDSAAGSVHEQGEKSSASAESKRAGERENATGSEHPDAAKRAAESSAHAASKAASQAETPSEPRHFHVFLRAPLATLDVGRMPKPSGALGAGLGARYDDWHVLLIGRIFGGQTIWAPDVPEVGAHVNRGTLELWACKGFRSGRWELAPCADLGLERMTARGIGTDLKSGSDATVSLMVGAAGVVRLELLGFLALVGSAAAGFDTSRPRLAAAGLDAVHELGWAWFSIGLGPEWIF
jgi:hypothetical protein